jgi:hypothetical protein
MSGEEIVAKKIRIERIYPADLQSHFVSNIVVQHQPDMFILSFFEIWPPPILGESEEEKQRELDALDHVEAKCVARLAVTPSKMKEFLETMSENLRNYERMMQIETEWD